MVVDLHSSPLSPNGQRVAVILIEKKIPFKLISAQNIKSEEYLTIHPFGQMPLIRDGDTTLFESRAIAHYIATKYPSSGTHLVPDVGDIEANARLDQATFCELGNFNGPASGIVTQKFINPRFGQPVNESLVKNYEKELERKLDGFERLLKRQKYIAGEELTLVDFYFLPYGEVLEKTGYDYLKNEVKWPNVARWWAEIAARPSWQIVKGGIPAEYSGEE